MHLPKLASIGKSASRLTGGKLRPPLKTLGPGSVSSLLKIALDVAYVLLALITGVLLLLSLIHI